MKTLAQKIVENHFDDEIGDGQIWPDGFEDAMEKATIRPPYHPGSDNNDTKYEFADGSCIVESNGAWDFGYSNTNCGCWVSQPHHCTDPRD